MLFPGKVISIVDGSLCAIWLGHCEQIPTVKNHEQ